MRTLLTTALATFLCNSVLAADAPPAATLPATAPASANGAKTAPPDPAKTVPRALTYLVENGNEWIEDRNCASCHHSPMMIWSLREAKAAGFPTDDKALAKAVEWSLSSKVDATTFPAPKSPERDLVSLAGSYLALAFAGTDNAPPEWWAKQLKDALQHQKPDGSWPPMKEGRAPILSTSPTHMTLFLANALAAQPRGKEDPAVTAAQEKAASWLSAQPPEDSTQFHALRMLFDTRLVRAAEEVKQSTDWLRAQQKNDGGWGQSPDLPSDAYATGQAVYALRASGVLRNDATILRARSFLTNTQATDGSWPMISRPMAAGGKGADNLEPITYIATAWATIALSCTEPGK